jgi:membrane-associated phospholipid phosphatase
LKTVAPDLTVWQVASALFFLYSASAGALLPRLAPEARRRAVGVALAGLLLTVASAAAPHAAILHDWVLPPSLLLLAYWSSGALFVAPMPTAEAVLLRIDAALGVPGIARRIPPTVAELLEVAYAGIYPLIPIALLLHLTQAPTPDPARFWTVVLVTDYICFAVLPWIQTRPPRALENEAPPNGRARAFNLRMLHRMSIQVNTCPSGHAAEAVAAALLVTGAPRPIVATMWVAALLVSAGAVFGRYHYAVDAITGWVVAAAVWVIFR